MSQPDPESLRASHGDREAVAAQLQDSLDAGRIDLGEFDERVRDAYGATTYDELNRLLEDLPGAVPAVPADNDPSPAAGGGGDERSDGFATGALACGMISVVNFFPFSILAIIFGAVGVDRANKGVAGGRTNAIAGLILGMVTLPVWITIIVIGSLFWWG